MSEEQSNEAELVATALATGAVPGLTGTPCGAVHDLYVALREGVRTRLAGGAGDGVRGGYGVRVLGAFETDPDVWRTRLLQVLTASGAATDEEIRAAARAVLRAERRTGRIITAQAAEADRVPIGHGGSLHNAVRCDTGP